MMLLRSEETGSILLDENTSCLLDPFTKVGEVLLVIFTGEVHHILPLGKYKDIYIFDKMWRWDLYNEIRKSLGY